MIKRSLEPRYDLVLSAIKHLSNEDLREFLGDDDKVEDMVKSCEQCKELETEKELIMAQNKSLAEYNLSLSPKLEKGKTRLKELCDSVQTVRDSVQEKQSTIKNHSGNLNGDTILALLQTAAVESEEESEKIAEKFYQKEIDMDEFLEQFQSFRKLMHLRRVKADKMNDILSKKQNFGSPIHSTKLPAPAVPYPIGAINMPYFPMAK